jgi:hypothetical protein
LYLLYSHSIDELQKNSKKIQDAQLFDIHVVPVQFLDDIQNDRPSIVMEKLKISTWGILPHVRKGSTISKPNCKQYSRSKKSVPEKITMKLKDGAAIDPDSGKYRWMIIFSYRDFNFDRTWRYLSCDER